VVLNCRVAVPRIDALAAGGAIFVLLSGRARWPRRVQVQIVSAGRWANKRCIVRFI
jgi:hypothetical protein